ncbi:predicted protein [Cyanophage PSS2]|nr:hypothetical protein PSS2_gp027 [Cyanophage PSS2]ACT65589.1 hypothetical protein [Cyanophage PSS2]ACY75731.1 predicted protein [Cyanophage PSS2]
MDYTNHQKACESLRAALKEAVVAGDEELQRAIAAEMKNRCKEAQSSLET